MMLLLGRLQARTARIKRRSLSERAVQGASDRLAPGVVDRRGFLWRATLVGTALALNPFDFILKPGTAYASVCGSGASCSSGWTAFCCTINKGANLCPSGSFAAGWWRVDDSSFCRGSARYIIDCNRRPGSSCKCRCASGTCDQRRVCCNRFRYGQCNQHIGGVTEVVCRVVTCTAPWKWDPSCTRTLRVDNRTRTHSAPCLPGTNPSHITMKYLDLGLAGAKVGTPIKKERAGADGGRVKAYTNGYITYLPAVGAWSVYGALARAYERNGLEAGGLGYATSDLTTIGDGRGYRNRFQRGWIMYTSTTRAQAVVRPFFAVYKAMGGPTGHLRYPIDERRNSGDKRGTIQRFENGSIHRTSETGVQAIFGSFHNLHDRLGGNQGRLRYPRSGRVKDPTGRGSYQRFEGGRIYRSSTTPTRAVIGKIFTRYWEVGASAGRLGFPTKNEVLISDNRGRRQQFEKGVILHTTTTGAWDVLKAWYEVYVAAGGPAGALGYPTGASRRVGDGVGERQPFEGGNIYWSASTKWRVVTGPIDALYRKEGGPRGWLGYPRTSVQHLSSGWHRVLFQHGYIRYNPTTGAISAQRA